MKRILFTLAALLTAGALLNSCGSSSQPTQSGLKFRVFASNPLMPSGTSNVPVLNIVDASKDQLSTSAVSLLSAVTDPELMIPSPDNFETLVFSASDTSLVLVSNTTESTIQGSSATSAAIKLPGATESIVMSPSSVPVGNIVYAALPNATVTGQPPGAVEVVNLAQGRIIATIPVPAAHYLLQSPDGNHILVFSDNSDVITDIAVSLIGTSTDPRTYVSGFDRPVGGIFTSNGNTLIFNCGLECGGTSAGVASFAVGSAGPTSTLALPAATDGLISGSTLYVAGTLPGTPCPSGTLAATCGTLSTVNVASMTATGSFAISDGYHNRIAMGANGQLFAGARNCTNITSQNNGNTGEIRGCLSIFNSQGSNVVIPPQNGNATGIQPITGRNVVYVAQNGFLNIYDTTTDKLATTQVNIVGNITDVLLVDHP